jgi:hypothetical protein
VRAVYLHPSGPTEPLEEALANAFACEGLPPGGKFRPSEKRFFRRQPSGYRDFEQFRPPRDFRSGRRQLATSIATATTTADRHPLELMIDPRSPDIRYADVPVRIVRDHADPRFALHYVKAIPVIQQVESAQVQRDLRRLAPEIVRQYQRKMRPMMEAALGARTQL